MDEHHMYLGYEIRNGKIVVKKDEAEIVKRIFAYAIDGKSANEIANIFNRENVRTFYNAKAWYHTRILKILRNREYTGIGMYPKIIKWSDYQKANNNIVNKVYKLRIKHPFNGFIRCNKSGGLYHPYKNRYDHSKIEWHCSKKKNKGKRYCDSQTLMNDNLNLKIDNSFKELMVNPHKIEIQPKKSNLRNLSEIKNLKDKLHKGINKKEDIYNLLNIIQRIAQLEYEDTPIDDHMLLYQKVYKTISKMEKADMIDYQDLCTILKEIVIDSTNNKIYIELINDQIIESTINI